MFLVLNLQYSTNIRGFGYFGYYDCPLQAKNHLGQLEFCKTIDIIYSLLLEIGLLYCYYSVSFIPNNFYLIPKYRVTHFYFHGLGRACFLRVHNPAKYGDYITRFTMDAAEKKQEIVHGIELGPFGTFTLRVVHPWRISGELAGYIEPKIPGIL